MSVRVRSRLRYFAVVLMLCLAVLVLPASASGAGATTSVRIRKYAADGATVLADRVVDYAWLEANLTVYGDGETHYYHQGPVFEGDPWDPGETQNLKDKGAVMGTAVRDLCGLVGGMTEGDEVMLVAVDGWHTEFAYANIYEPLPEQGLITLAWYCGEMGDEGERYGTGYPANNAYGSAMQIVFMCGLASSEGKYVFGNADMKTALPQAEYQHFFEGQYPSTNGLSGKWISEVRVYGDGVPDGVEVSAVDALGARERDNRRLWLPSLLGLAGLALVWSSRRTRRPAR